MSPTVLENPHPPAFLDPLTDVDTCYYYAVPKFFGQSHPNTRWLIAMLKNGEEDRIKHKMEVSPAAFKGAYYQMADNPQLYTPEDVAASPMFKRQAVVYLSPLAMALYLNNAAMVELQLKYRNTYDEPLYDINEPQFATHLQDNALGDFHAFPIFMVMMRRGCFSCAQTLQRSGWDHTKPVAMPMRRRFERRVLYFRDWLEVALAVLATRPMFQLQSLVREMTKGTSYAPLRMPIVQFLPPDPATAEPSGLIGVDQLPQGTRMIGVRSLLDMAEHYDRYIQMRQCAKQVAALKREATAVGLNPEVLMIQALDFDGGNMPNPDQEENSNAYRGANNSSSAPNEIASTVSPAAAGASQSKHVVLNVNMSANKGKNVEADPQYVSEGCRILHFALTRDTNGKNLQICIDAFCILLRRGFYLLSSKPEMTSSLARDVRNTVILMLNLIQREESKVDAIVEKIKSGVKRFAHLEEHKQLENRKTACIQGIAKLVAVLTKLLLHTKFLVGFIQAEFPPFNATICNIQLNPYLAQKFDEIKFGVMREFNGLKTSWQYLDKEMLQTVSGINEMQMHFRVGKKPNIVKGKKGAGKNKNNMSNTNSCFVSYRRVLRRPKPSAASVPSAAETAAAAMTDKPVSLSVFSATISVDSSTDNLAALTMDNSSIATDDLAGSVFDLSGVLRDRQCATDADEATVSPSMGSRAVNLLQPTPAPDEQRSSSMAKASSAATATTAAAVTSSDMEQLLASLCREVDSLFRPLEDSTVTGTAPEHSTIEPDLATTPMPTPRPELTPPLCRRRLPKSVPLLASKKPKSTGSTDAARPSGAASIAATAVGIN